MLEASRNNYILVLIRALEKRALDGTLDEELAARIERMLGFGSEAGDREYESWLPIPAAGVGGNEGKTFPPRGNDGGEHA